MLLWSSGNAQFFWPSYVDQSGGVKIISWILYFKKDIKWTWIFVVGKIVHNIQIENIFLNYSKKLIIEIIAHVGVVQTWIVTMSKKFLSKFASSISRSIQVSRVKVIRDCNNKLILFYYSPRRKFNFSINDVQCNSLKTTETIE